MPEPDAAIRNRRRIGLTELVLVNLHKSFSRPHGLAEASETAVLNANYLKARLAERRAGERVPVAFDRHCMHEFVLSGKPMTKESLDAFADAIEQILAEADPEKAKQAPIQPPSAASTRSKPPAPP